MENAISNINSDHIIYCHHFGFIGFVCQSGQNCSQKVKSFLKDVCIEINNIIIYIKIYDKKVPQLCHNSALCLPGQHVINECFTAICLIFSIWIHPLLNKCRNCNDELGKSSCKVDSLLFAQQHESGVSTDLLCWSIDHTWANEETCVLSSNRTDSDWL